MNKVIKSLKSINLRLYLALLVLGLCPAIYTTLRTFFLGQLFRIDGILVRMNNTSGKEQRIEVKLYRKEKNS